MEEGYPFRGRFSAQNAPSSGASGGYSRKTESALSRYCHEDDFNCSGEAIAKKFRLSTQLSPPTLRHLFRPPAKCCSIQMLAEAHLGISVHFWKKDLACAIPDPTYSNI